MSSLILVRHGQSEYNLENRYAGWADIDLTKHGEREAIQAGRLLKEKGYTFDIAYVSVLKRAIRTLNFILEEMDLAWIPVQKSWRLNVPSYGALQGELKTDVASLYGEEKIHLWKSSYDIRPPQIQEIDRRHPKFDARYRTLTAEEKIPGESLKDGYERLIPLWQGSILPNLTTAKKVLVVAHGSTLRLLIKHLEQLAPEDMMKMKIPTATPIIYELDRGLEPIKRYYLES